LSREPTALLPIHDVVAVSGTEFLLWAGNWFGEDRITAWNEHGDGAWRAERVYAGSGRRVVRVPSGFVSWDPRCCDRNGGVVQIVGIGGAGSAG
jgi:hypothetical protein